MDGISWWSEDILRQTTSGSRQNSLNSNSLSLEQEQQHLGRHFLIEYHGEGTYLPCGPSMAGDPKTQVQMAGLRLYAHHRAVGPKV